MASKLWIQQGDSESYRLTIPADCETISEVITLIGTNSFVKTQLDIPPNPGKIKLLRPYSEPPTFISNGITLELLRNEDGFINDFDHPIVIRIHTSRETKPSTTLFEKYSSFTETLVLTDHTCLDFYQKLRKPYPHFALYPTQCINNLKNWISLGLLAELPAGNLVAVNGFTKTGKSTLALSVLPSLLKMRLAAKPVDFKIAFAYFEISKHKGDGFAIAHSFLSELHENARAMGFVTETNDCKHINDVIARIKSLMNQLHEFAEGNNLRILFVWDEIQRFFQCEDYLYETMVELFKFLCVSGTPRKWSNFFFVLTGSGMAMAWRGFKSSSVQGYPLYTEIRNINIESNNSVVVQNYVYNKCALFYPCDVAPAFFMNPACIAWHCNVTRSRSVVARDAIGALERKLLEEICEDIVPLLQTFTVHELKTIFLLAHDVCPTDPDLFFRTSKSYFDQFLQEYYTSVPEHSSRFSSFFPLDVIPTKIYGIGYDSTYTPVLQLLVRKEGVLDTSTILSLQNTRLPFSLQTANVMNTLNHCGEALYSFLKSWKKTGFASSTLSSVETAVQKVFGSDISNNPIFDSFINDANNIGFKNQLTTQYFPLQKPFPFYGSCLLVAFRNCTIHSGLTVAYGYFPGKDADIINLARAIRDYGKLSDVVTCFLHYL